MKPKIVLLRLLKIMSCKGGFIGLTLLLGMLGFQLYAQHTDPLPRSNPEAEGVSSAAIIKFLDAVSKTDNDFHSFMFLRHGKVITEAWWNPYLPGAKNTLYSVSKSLTSTAVGFAVQDGLLKVDDKVVSFFPQELPDSVGTNLAQLTVKDLLIMSGGQEMDPLMTPISDTNWVHAFLSIPVIHKPGTLFYYNSLGVYMLAAIVEKVTGKKELDYLNTKFFRPLGIHDMDWEVSPQGINTGGWGLRLKTEDMAKVGQFYLQKGNWRGRQLLPTAWIDEATHPWIEQGDQWNPGTPKDSSDWKQGYGYLFWRCRHGAFRADGAYGQFIIVMPDQDAVVVISEQADDDQAVVNLVWKYLLPAMQAAPLAREPQTETALLTKLASLKKSVAAVAHYGPTTVAPSTNRATSDPSARASQITTINPSIATTISGRTFSISSNASGISAVSFVFTDNECQMTLKDDSGVYNVAYGGSEWKRGKTNMRPPNMSKSSVGRLMPFQVAGSYCWLNDKTLELVMRFIETPHTQTITCHFDRNRMDAGIHNSSSPSPYEKTVIVGEIKTGN